MSRGIFVLVVCLIAINTPVLIDVYNDNDNDNVRLAFDLYNSTVVFLDFLLSGVGLVIYIVLNWNVPFKK